MMDIETCIKYFEFLNNECDRYLKDGGITEEEIHQLKIEMDRFIEMVMNSDLPFSLRQKIVDKNWNTVTILPESIFLF